MRGAGRRPRIPSYLVLGHVTKDIVDSRFRYGGTALYAALTATRLGERVALVTSAAPDLPLGQLLPETPVVSVPAPATTVFVNLYRTGERLQFVGEIASAVRPHNVPRSWRSSPIVHLAPVAQELDQRIARMFPRSLVGLTAQGFLRRWDADGRVRRAAWTKADATLPNLDILIVSEDDIDSDFSLIRSYASQIPIAVVTLGERGAEVYHRGEVHHSPAFRARVVDPTGAGDAFAAAYLIKCYRGGDPFESARFANCVASFVVEDEGARGIPSLEQVQRRLAQGD